MNAGFDVNRLSGRSGIEVHATDADVQSAISFALACYGVSDSKVSLCDRATVKEHRDELEIQIASFGIGLAPAHLVIAFREDEESIARIDAKLQLVTVPIEIPLWAGEKGMNQMLPARCSCLLHH